MERDALYRNVITSVRTPRFAVLINKNDKYWPAYVEGAISVFSQTWGGEYFLMIPTDGKTIDEKFWQILEAYSPDKLGVYLPTLLDLEYADPEQYEKVKQRYKEAWQLPNDQDFEKTWRGQARLVHFNELTISEKLSQELKNRLSPFYFQDHIIGVNVRREDTLGFPFTRIVDIVEFAKDKPAQISVPMKIENREMRLMASARAGAATDAYLNELRAKGLQTLDIPEEFGEERYVLALEKGAHDFKLHQTISKAYGSNVKYPDENYFSMMPFTLSMLKLGKYYRLTSTLEDEENITVIIGNSIEDYCLYYCLARLQQSAYWLPEDFLRNANNKFEASKNRPEGAEVEKYTPTEQLAASLVVEYFAKIGYGHQQNFIAITSTSLTTTQLEECRQWMDNIFLFSSDNILSRIAVKPLEEVSANCIFRAIELNNNANQQDMVFQNGQSVGRVNTPKPKNFTFIDPAKHRWMTSLMVSGYYPPSLPFLGSKIVQLHNTSYETRVAIDGLAYNCPNIGTFGEDIDNNTVRPELRLLDEAEIFTQYFDYSGFKIKLSDKGSYLKDTIERFGSLEEVARFFKSEDNRNTFGQFLYEKKDSDKEVIYLDTERRTYLSFEAFNRKLGSKDKTIELLDELINKDILRRGLIFQCSRCRLAEWYDISDVSKVFKCKRCDLVQQYVHSSWKWPEEPRWYYSLVETVYLFYKSSSHLTALSLDKIRQGSRVAFHYLCETEIIDFPKVGEKIEVDILAISDGKIVLGECKDREPKANDLKKYLNLYSRLKILPAHFVLATTQESIPAAVSSKLAQIKNSKVLLRTDLYS